MNGQYRDHVWINYSKNIMAASAPDAVFLATFINYMEASHDYTSALEIVDLQKYKVIRKQTRVRIALRERLKIPFIFVVGIN